MSDDTLEWILRWGVAGTFFGHGMWALTIKQGWFKYFTALGITEASIPALLLLIGTMDVLVALVVLWRPYRWVLGWATFWAFLTALIRPVTASPILFGGLFTVEILDFVERTANFMVPLALLVYYGVPKKYDEWFKH